MRKVYELRFAAQFYGAKRDPWWVMVMDSWLACHEFEPYATVECLAICLSLRKCREVKGSELGVPTLKHKRVQPDGHGPLE
ncbi:hypothetical protein TNCV_2120251 [Trichonephila clavipes]|nr:hypothetical protein TNCV_2120251 [Trichonephila clavipes]